MFPEYLPQPFPLSLSAIHMPPRVLMFKELYLLVIPHPTHFMCGPGQFIYMTSMCTTSRNA